MLHLLLSIALCIFIGERLWHYGAIWREWRLDRREMRRIEALYNSKPPIEPAPVWLAATLVAMMVAFVVFFVTRA